MNATKKLSTRNLIITLISVAVVVLFALLPTPDGLDRKGMLVLGLMASAMIMWVSEAVNMAVTTILVCVLIPFFGIMPAADMYASFAGKVFFFMIGTFSITAALATTSIPTRIAGFILNWAGKNPRKLVLGFTIGTGLPDTLNAYAMSKAKFAQVLSWYADQCRQKGTPITVCNVELENFYGEDEPTDRFLPGTVAKLKRNEKILLTAGTQVRDFVYVEDVLTNLMAVMDSENLPEYLDLPLGSGEGVSIRDLITYLKELVKSDSELCFGAVPSRMNEPDSVADRQKMEQYGLTVRYGWKDGMKTFL